MNLNSFELIFKKREMIGSVEARKIRKMGDIPANFSSKSGEAISAIVDEKSLQKALESKTLFNRFTKIKIENKEYLTFAKVVQKHPVSGKILHIDFQIVEPKDVIEMKVPVEFTDKAECEAIKLGAILNIVSSYVLIKGKVEDMCETLKCSLKNAEAKKSLTLKNLEIPSNVSISNKFKANVIATILGSKKKAEQEETK